MTDRELLELAAKAAGLSHVDYTGVGYDGRIGLMLTDEMGRQTVNWSPLTDDGDALRLLAQLGLELFFSTMTYDMCACVIKERGSGLWMEPFGPDKLAATRRAIVRAAADIGREE